MDEQTHSAKHGQILILFAFFLTAMVGIMALSVDLGVSFTERRAMQNAADAGALAGARIVAKSAGQAGLTALSTARTAADPNAMKIGAVDQFDCSYVDDGDSVVGDCSGTPPTAATGVKVAVYETHPTFFMRAIPGGAKTARISATATAHVMIVQAPSDGPFLPCANAALAGNTKSTTPIVVKDASGRWTINPAAIGVSFYIHGPQVNRCGLDDSSYKGIADQAANINKTISGNGTWFGFTTGTVAGPVAADVDGANGCLAGQVVDKCVMFLPIVVNTPAPSKVPPLMWAVTYAPFYITQPNVNEHDGVLLASYLIDGKGKPGSLGWYKGYSGAVVVRLTQ